MTPLNHWTPLALLVCASMTASCAASRPPSAEPPRLLLPTEATRPCTLERLPEAPTQADLEVAYVERGLSLVACDNARRLAVETLEAERTLQDRWRRETQRSMRRFR